LSKSASVSCGRTLWMTSSGPNAERQELDTGFSSVTTLRASPVPRRARSWDCIHVWVATQTLIGGSRPASPWAPGASVVTLLEESPRACAFRMDRRRGHLNGMQVAGIIREGTGASWGRVVDEGTSVTDTCDVLVCGAGPAGSTAAIGLAQAGLKTVLCDGQTFPRDKACAGWVNARAFAEFGFLKDRAEALCERTIYGMTFLSPNLDQRTSYEAEDVQGYVVSRRQFDHGLARLATEAGATLVEGTALTELRQAEDSVLAVLEGGHQYRAQFLVGADGVNTVAGRLSGLNPGFADDDLVVAVEQEFPASPGLLEELGGERARLLIALAYDYIPGYGWVFPHRETVSVGVGARMDRISNIRETHRKFVADLQDRGLLPRDADPGEARSALIPAGAALTRERTADGRVLLVGDAGGFVAAATGEGIYPGMQTGRLAAQAIVEGLSQGKHAEVAETYRTLVRRELTAHLEMPAVDLSLMMDLLFKDQRLADKLARAFLFGEPI